MQSIPAMVSNPPAWPLQFALDINDARQIIVNGTQDQTMHAALLTPDPNSLPANTSPDKPVLLSPENGAVLTTLTPVLETGPYSDADNSRHTFTQWQISTTDDFSDIISDTTVQTNEFDDLRLAIPEGKLLPGGYTYYWRVRFMDIDNAYSEWAEPFSFTTYNTPPNQPVLSEPAIGAVGGGLTPTLKCQAFFDIDGNSLAQTEWQVSTEADLSVLSGTLQIGLKVQADVASADAAKRIDPADIGDTANRPADAEMPYGLLAFRLYLAAGQTATQVVIYFSTPIPADAKWYKYDSINGWQDYSTHALLNDNRTQLTLDLQDGGYGDADGVANGMIIDPSGLVVPSEISNKQVAQSP